MEPLVSVVVPCYNAEKYIGECIVSILAQDYPNVEIIFVDDCSTDGSFGKLWQYSGVRIFRNDRNRGECFTSEYGFLKARGKYVCRLSADDAFATSGHISRQVLEMEKYNLDWCYNSVNLIGGCQRTAARSQTSWLAFPIRYSSVVMHHLDNLVLKFPNICYMISGIGNPINTSALMFRRDAIKHISWDAYGLRSVCDAMVVSWLFKDKLKARAIPMVGSFYRIHPNQATGKKEANENMVRAKKMIYQNVIDGEFPVWMKVCSFIILRSGL